MTLEAQMHQDVPFEFLVKTLQPERNPGQNPLFQVMIALEPPLSTLPSGWTLTQMDIKADAAKFDLYLELDDRPEGLVGRFEYNTDLFDKESIVRMTDHWQTLLEGIVATPEKRVSELPILAPAEQQRVVVEWNATQTPYPDQCVHSLFEAQVLRTPDAVALLYENRQMTYQEVNGRANQLARYLQALGVKEETLVSICMERSLDMVVGLLAILKAGGAYIPLDPTYPKERIAFMLNDAHTPVLLTQQRIVAQLPHTDARLVCIDTDWHIISDYGVENVTSGVKQENLAYVIYTSGSTGKPKGVMISHRAICNHMVWMQSRFPLTASDSVLQKTPFSFDASVWEFYAPLHVGGRLVIAKPGGHQDSEYLIKTIEEHKITILQLVPSLLQHLLENKEVERCRSLKRVFCGGEELPSSYNSSFLCISTRTCAIFMDRLKRRLIQRSGYATRRRAIIRKYPSDIP